MERSSMLKALAFNCSLKSASGGETSSTEVLLSQLISQLHRNDVETEVVRAVDHDIKPGTERATRGPPYAPNFSRRMLL